MKKILTYPNLKTGTSAVAPVRGVQKSSPIFDYATGAIQNASPRERIIIRALQYGARISSLWAYRGFGMGARVLQRLTPGSNLTLLLEKDTAFSFPFADGYWSMLLGGSERYEVEIEKFLKSIAGEKYTLLDCGANFGYWSVLASGRLYGSQRVIAVEPSSRTFDVLRNNSFINKDRFICIRKAIGDRADVALLRGSKHEARSICGAAGAGGEHVEVIALNSLLESAHISAGERLVIKLDVEGVEIPALSGAARLLEGDAIVICEEHGSDRHHTVSRHILEKTPLKLFCHDPRAGCFRRITDVASLDHIKRFRNRGYNVFATASLFWEQKILAHREQPAEIFASGKGDVRLI